MKLKKLLSFALALAMVLAFVPALSLTASAASTTTITDSLGGEVIWSAPTYGTLNDNAVASYWSGWSESGNYANLRTYDGYDVLQFYSAYYVNCAATVTASDDVKSASQDAETLIIEWKFKGQSSSDCYYDFTFNDANGYEIAFLKMDKNHTSVDAANSYKMGYPDNYTDLAIVAQNNDDGTTHTVYYCVSGSVVYSESVDGTFSGFGSIAGSDGYWTDYTHIGFADLTIAGASENVTAVTATYVDENDNDIVVKTDTRLYDPSVTPAGCTFPALDNYTADGLNYFYSVDATALPADGLIPATAAENTDVNGYAEGNYVRFDSDSDGTDEGYVIKSGNLIPNGTFSSLDGWYDGNGDAASVWTLGNNSITLSSQTQADAHSLRRSWMITPGTKYLYTYYTSAGGNKYHQTSLQTELQQSENSSNLLIGTSSDDKYSGSVASLDATGQNIFIFDVDSSSSYKYLQAGFRWSNATFSNFGLYEVEHDDSVLATTTIKYVNSEGTEIDSTLFATVDGVIGDVIDLTDTSIVPATLDVEGTTYSLRDTRTEYEVQGQTDVVEIVYASDWVVALADDIETSIISGSKPILPTTVEATTQYGATTTVSGVEWDTDNVSFENDGSSIEEVIVYGSIDGLDDKATATVYVYPCYDDSLASEIQAYAKNSFANSENDTQNYFNYSLTGTAAFEYDVTINSFTVSSDPSKYIVSITQDIQVFGSDGISFQGSSDTSNGYYFGFRNNDSSTNKCTDLFEVTLGATYRVFITTNIPNNTYSATVTDSDGNAVLTVTDEAYRGNGSVSYLNDLIVACNYGSDTRTEDMVVTNFRVYAPIATISYSYEGTPLGSIEAEIGDSVDAKTFYYEGKIYSADGIDEVTGDTDVPAKVAQEYAVQKDIFWTSDGNEIYGGTDGSHLFVSSYGDTDGEKRAYETDADGNYVYAGAPAPMGKSRFTVVQYARPTYEEGKTYTLVMPVYTFSGCNLNDGVSVRFAAYKLADNFEIEYDQTTRISPVYYTDYPSTGNAIYSDWVDNTATELVFDITDAVKNATGDTITFKILAARVGVKLNNWEITVLGGEKEGLASYIAIDDGGYTVTVDDSSTLTVNGSLMSDTTATVNDGDYIYAYGKTYYVESTSKDVYDGSTKIDVASNMDLTGVEHGVTLIDGAQIRIGNGFNESTQDLLGNSGLRFIAKVGTTYTLANEADTLDGTDNLPNVGIAIFDGAFSTTKFDATTAETTYKDATPLVEIAAKQYQDEGNSIFTAAIVNLADTSYNRVYVAVPYAVVGGNTYYNWTAAVARTPYEVASGILTSEGDGSVEDDEGTSYTDKVTDALVKVLNVYTNKTGARISLYQTNGVYSVGTVTYANDATAFFEVESSTLTDNGDGSYTITLNALGDAVFYDSYAGTKYRVNNASATSFEGSTLFDEVTVGFDNVDSTIANAYKTMTITFTPASASE